jgi:hypothetical protein
MKTELKLIARGTVCFLFWLGGGGGGGPGQCLVLTPTAGVRGTGTAQEAHLSVQGWALGGGAWAVFSSHTYCGSAGYRYSTGSPLICSGVGIMCGGLGSA